MNSTKTVTHVVAAQIKEGTPQTLEHNDIRWIKPCEIPEYNFCPADKEILKRIMRENYE